jgi:hypothetical protein
MNAQINGVLEQIRVKLAESAWGGPGLPSMPPDASPMPPTAGAPGSASMTSTEVEDALDMYLSGMVDSLMNQYDATDEEAADTVFAAIDQAVADGKLPELPDDDASEQEVSLWVGKATLARLQHLVNEYARNNAEEA